MDKLKTYTVKQATELLGMEKQTIMGFLRDGELPYMQFKQSGNIYIKATELTKFMDRFTVS